MRELSKANAEDVIDFYRNPAPSPTLGATRPSFRGSTPTTPVFAFMTGGAPPMRPRSRQDTFDCELCRELRDAGVSPEPGTEFDTRIHFLEYAHATKLYRVAAPVDAVYSVLSGAVKVVKAETNGDQRIVRVLRPGDIAEVESIPSLAFEHTAIAAGRVRACRIPIAWFRQGVAASVGLQTLVLGHSLAALKETETWLSQLTARAIPARTRTARLLLRLRVDDEGPCLMLSGNEMGSILNIRPETVSRILSDFRREGIVAKGTHGAITQGYLRCNIVALEEISQEN